MPKSGFAEPSSDRARRSRLTIEHKLYVFYGLASGKALSVIARELNCGNLTIRKLRKTWFQDPSSLTELCLIVKKGSQKFVCRMCKEERSSYVKGMRHVASHVLPIERVSTYPWGNVKPPYL